MLKFNVRHQQLSRVDSFRPVEKSVNYLTAKFAFLTKDWNDTDRKAVCKNLTTGKTYDAPISDDNCLIPWEALDTSGKFEICVHSVGIYPKITTAICTVDLGRTLPDGTETNPPSPTALDLIRQDIEDLNNKVEGLAGVTPEQIQQAVEDYLEENPIEGGATAEQSAQIEANRAAIEEINKQDYASKQYVFDQGESVFDASCQYTKLAFQQAGQNIEQTLSGYYTKPQIDAIMGSYINDIDDLIGGDS